MRTFVLLFSVVLVAPSVAFAEACAQASVTGVVRDSSARGPGVTVEASSPVLIEKVRTAVTDDAASIASSTCRPGTYTVTFTLTGFGTVKREGIELTGSFTATVNADLRVGAVEETITVTGESPIVDVQSARRQQVLDRETSSAPSRPARAYHGLVDPRSRHDDVDRRRRRHWRSGDASPSRFTAAARTKGVCRSTASASARTSTAAACPATSPTSATPQEVTFTTSGGLGEAEVGGPVMSIVPRTGGNTIAGSFFANGANDGMQGSNYTRGTACRRVCGLPNELIKLWDVNGAFGGPIRKDRLWYFVNVAASGEPQRT